MRSKPFLQHRTVSSAVTLLVLGGTIAGMTSVANAEWKLPFGKRKPEAKATAPARTATARTSEAASKVQPVAAWQQSDVANKPKPVPAAVEVESEEPMTRVVPPVPQPATQPATQQPMAADKLSLADLEQLAMANNPTLEQAAAGVEVERGSLQQAGLYPNPQVGYVNGTSNRSTEKQSNGAFFSQEFVTAGKLKKAQAWEANEVNKVAWDLEAQRTRVMTDVRIRYFDVLGAQHSVRTLKKLEQLADRGRQTVQQLYEGKAASRADVLQAKIQLETVRVSLDEAIERHRAAWQQLANVIGLADLPMAALDGTLDGELPTLDQQQAWERLLASSPQLRSAEAERDHAYSEMELAESQAVPNVTLQMVAEYDRAANASTLSSLVALPLPVFNRNQGNIYRASSDIRVANSEIERTKLVLRDLLSDSFRRYQTNLKQAQRFHSTILPDAQENLDLVEKGYRAGESSLLEVLTARQTYFEAELAYLDALTEVRKVSAEIEGLQLTGGLNPAAAGAALQASGGSSTGRQRALLNQVQQSSSQRLLNAAQIAR